MLIVSMITCDYMSHQINSGYAALTKSVAVPFMSYLHTFTFLFI